MQIVSLVSGKGSGPMICMRHGSEMAIEGAHVALPVWLPHVKDC